MTSTQTVIITEGATGLGYAIAKNFLEAGANVTLNARTLSNLKDAAQRLNRPNQIQIVAGYITNPDFAFKLVAATVSKFGRVDVLVKLLRQ